MKIKSKNTLARLNGFNPINLPEKHHRLNPASGSYLNWKILLLSFPYFRTPLSPGKAVSSILKLSIVVAPFF
jgi:hypothetical protein